MTPQEELGFLRSKRTNPSTRSTLLCWLPRCCCCPCGRRRCVVESRRPWAGDPYGERLLVPTREDPWPWWCRASSCEGRPLCSACTLSSHLGQSFPAQPAHTNKRPIFNHVVIVERSLRICKGLKRVPWQVQAWWIHRGFQDWRVRCAPPPLASSIPPPVPKKHVIYHTDSKRSKILGTLVE